MGLSHAAAAEQAQRLHPRPLTIEEAQEVRRHLDTAFGLALEHLQKRPGAWQEMRFAMADAACVLNRAGITSWG